ncbi:MAG: PAS domain S-box protein, partial [Deltaproteobacteria bacterium]|nr:PAS domain S-box protein [Deltaproteobacteria bacterium]
DIEVKEKQDETATRIRKIKEVGQDRFETRHRGKDGTVVDVEISVNYLPTDGGRMSVFIRDITERKQAEEELRKSEQLFRLIFQVSPDSITITGPNEEYIDVNPGFTLGTGYTREEVLGVTSEDLKLWVDDGSLEMLRKTLTERGIINNMETRFRTKDGFISDSIFSATVFEINNEYHALSLSKDISELKEAQKEKSRLETQLQQVQKMESIGTLAGGIAHDFNNLLMGIQGKTSILLYNINKDDAVYDQIKSIEQLIQNGSEITSQLLGLARRGKFEVNPENLNKLVQNSSKMFASTNKEIKIHRKYQKNIWAVEINKNQIDQVLLNLFINASQAMPKGGDIYIETENVMLDEVYVKPYLVDPGKFVKISVSDTGVGMDEETMQKIFDPFFTTKDEGKETGLGLASAYGIINNHNGIINVYSEKGVGTTFNIYLQVTDKKVVDYSKPQEKIIKGSETILFIDDEQRIIDAGKEMLEIIGYKVLLAASGKAAIETYRKNGKIIDLVILDMILPEMDGSKIYDRLKDINPNVKVLLSSGFTQNGQATEILDKGCNGFIQKPFTLEQLSQKISEILNKK